MSVSDRLDELGARFEDSPLNFVRLGAIVSTVMLGSMTFLPEMNYPSWILLAFSVLAINFVLYGILLMGLNLQYGYAGIVNFGPVLFFGIGAYATAMITADSTFKDIGYGLPWYYGIAAALIAVVVVALLIGISTIRLRADYLAIVTLAAAEIFHEFTLGLEFLGGQTGIPGVPTLFQELARDNYYLTGFTSFFFLIGILIISYGIINRLGESPFGRVLRGIRDDEDAIRSLGKNVFSYKLVTFVTGSLLMGLAGSLLVLFEGTVSPGYINIDVTVLVWVGMLIGGAGNNRGVLGGLLIISAFQLFSRFGSEYAPITSQTFAQLRLMAIGLLMILIIAYRPQGIWGDPEKQDVET